MADAITQITTLASSAMDMITGNSVLMVFFCGGLFSVAFNVIRNAKRSSK